jgi:Pyruvate/2-oxoacid:ferredoxin oxidoreductase delta subunit
LKKEVEVAIPKERDLNAYKQDLPRGTMLCEKEDPEQAVNMSCKQRYEGGNPKIKSKCKYGYLICPKNRMPQQKQKKTVKTNRYRFN